MRHYDHEPTISELFIQLEKEYAYCPAFMPQVKIPILGKVINKMINRVMVNTLVFFLL